MGIFNRLFGRRGSQPTNEMEYQEGEIPGLIKALGDEDAHIRLRAVRKLGETKDVRAVDGLIGALKDEEDYVRWNAAEALGKIGDERAINPLIAALKDKRETVQKDAMKALTRFANQTAFDAVLNYEKARSRTGKETEQPEFSDSPVPESSASPKVYGELVRDWSNSDLFACVAHITTEGFTQSPDVFKANIGEMLKDKSHVLSTEGNIASGRIRIELSFAQSALVRAQTAGFPPHLYAFSLVAGLSKVGADKLKRTEDKEGRVFLTCDTPFPALFGLSIPKHKGGVVVVESIGQMLLKLVVAEEKTDFQPTIQRLK